VFRTTDIVFISAIVAAAAFTYTTKHKVEAQLADVRRIEARIRFEQDQIALLKADWSLLTQPAHLQKLAVAFDQDLGLKPVEASQIVGLDDIPFRPPVETEPADPGDQIARTGKDSTQTGAIAR